MNILPNAVAFAFEAEISYFVFSTANNFMEQEGKIFHSAFFSYLFRQDSSVEQFQIQYNEDEIELHVKMIEELPYKILYEKYINKVKEHLKFKKYSLFINEPFLLSSNAKHRYVIDNRLNK